MSLVISDLEQIAALAQLELGEAQVLKSMEQLNNIFNLVEQMRTVDTSGLEPLHHPIALHMPELSLRLREDAVTEENRRDDYQECAPATKDGLYLVPKVIE